MALLSLLRERGYLAAIDSELARVLGRLGPESDPDVLFGAALASRHVREGHVCAELAALAGRPVLDPEGATIGDARFPELAAWRRALSASPLVSDGGAFTPLVLDGHDRLYLARYFQHEAALAERLCARTVPAELDRAPSALAASLARVFGAPGPEPDLQRVAAMVALLMRTLVLIGGPGTGKTTTVVKLLALLCEHSPQPPRIALMAPTGKAAARLSEAVVRAKSTLDAPAAVKAAIVEQASTIHRALGSVGSDGTRFVHGRDNPLPVDIVVVDESSMVDVALMRRLLDAVPDAARLLLLGDADQLVSVEAGAVLGDICSGLADHEPSAALRARAQRAFGDSLGRPEGPEHPLRDCIVELRKSHRFDPERGIGAVAECVKRGDSTGALGVLRRPGSEAELSELGASDLVRALSAALVEGYRPYTRAASPAQALALLERFRLLAAHRRGPRGVEAMNALAERALVGSGLLPPDALSRRFYPGRPLLVTENDYALGLFNGDVGVTFPGPSGSLRAYFASPGGGLFDLSPARLPPHETVFATSIHKSQGSEFDEVLVVLPEASSPLCTRELVYTAVTRARFRARLFGTAEALERAVTRRAQRASGLADALWR
jgi:exodeoxyribonuclease V alpha subunit